MSNSSLVVWFGLVLCLGLSEYAAAGQRLQTIKGTGTINIGSDWATPPFYFYNAERKPTGFEVEFSEALAKQLGVKATFIFGKTDSIFALLDGHPSPYWKNKQLDIVISHVSTTSGYEKMFDFSEPYIVSGMQALTLEKNEGTIKTAADLAGKKVGVSAYTNNEQWLKTYVPRTTVKSYDDAQAMYQDLNDGLTDAVLTDHLVALELVNGPTKYDGSPSHMMGGIDKLQGIALAGELLTREEFGVVLRSGEPELLAAVNQAIEKLRADGTLKKISLKYFHADVTQ